MMALSRQVIGVDVGSLFTILWSVLWLGILVYWLNWFYKAVKRIEQSVESIKSQLEDMKQSQT